jgi:glycosyltransferase involved in cell wall biosynthesis
VSNNKKQCGAKVDNDSPFVIIKSMRSLTKTSKAKVDVLLPYWGDFTLLKKAVESILAQTEKKWRLLIVDDCYPSDEATKYFSNFPDKRVVYHRHKKNIGLVRNYNYALGQATSDYCVVMGCDDIMLPTYLETALAKIGDADYYQPGVDVIDETDRIYLPIADRMKRFLRPKKEGIYGGEGIATSLCHGNWTYFPSLLWKTSTLKRYGFDQDHPNTQDVITQFNIICDGGLLYVDKAKTFQYRRSDTSFSSKAKGGTRFHEENEIYNDLAKRFREIGWNKAARAAYLHITVRLHQFLS